MSEAVDTERIYLEADAKWDAEDFAGAVALAHRGAALGDANCRNLLGCAYGVGLGVTKSFSRSMHWHRRAWAIEPQNGSWCSNIAITYAQAGSHEQAEF